MYLCTTATILQARSYLSVCHSPVTILGVHSLQGKMGLSAKNYCDKLFILPSLPDCWPLVDLDSNLVGHDFQLVHGSKLVGHDCQLVHGSKLVGHASQLVGLDSKLVGPDSGSPFPAKRCRCRDTVPYWA